jgi:transcriptional regulator with XRE-family HTH domain
VSKSASYECFVDFERIENGHQAFNPLFMEQLLPTYLLTLRKRSGLSQLDLAELLDITGSALSRFESQSRNPTLELAIGVEVIFGHGVRDVFPAFYRGIEQSVVARARDHCEREASTASRAQLRFIHDVVERASQTTLGL